MASKPGSGGKSARGGAQEPQQDLAKVATISIEGQVLPLHSWSMAGFRCGGYRGLLRPGQRTGVRIIIPGGDGPQSFDLMAEIESRDMISTVISGKFTGTSQAQLERMNAIFAQRLSGRPRPG